MPKNDNKQYQADMIFGYGEEERIKPVLEEYFGALNKLEKYNPFDFENKDYIIELKSRRINHNKYNTLMFNYSKLEKLEAWGNNNPNKIAIFVFNCDDGIFYWEYDSTQFTIGKGGRCDRGCNEYSTMAYIDIKYLQQLDISLTFNKEEEKKKCCECLKKGH